MSIPFFEKWMDEIEISNRNDLRYKFSQIDCSVPTRKNGRRTYHRERESLKIYMDNLADMNKLQYPFKIVKQETPDFIITRESKSTIGLEHTEATTKQIQQIFVDVENSQNGILDVSSGLPTFGDGKERKSAEIIIFAIANKIEKLNKPNYKLCQRNELLVYTDICPKGNEDIALKFLIPKYKDMKFHKRYNILFDSISIIFKQTLCHNVLP